MQKLREIEYLSNKQLDLMVQALRSYSLSQLRVYIETKNQMYKDNENMLDSLADYFKQIKVMRLNEKA